MTKRYIIIMIATISIILNGCTAEEDINNEFVTIEVEKSISSIEEDIFESDQTITELKERIQELESDNIELKNAILAQSIESEYYYKTSNIADEFIQSYISRDIDMMKSLVSDKFVIDTEYISYLIDDEEIKLYYTNRDSTYRMNNYGVEEDYVFYQYLVYVEAFNGIESGFLVNLHIRLVEGMWEVDVIEFDI